MPFPQQDYRKAASLTGFRGLNERRIIGANVAETASLDNVLVRNGEVIGRGGSSLWGSINTTANDYIIGLWQFDRSTLNTGTLIRMTSTKIAYWTGAAWTDITGTDLAGTSTTRPQACTVGEIDTFVAVNEGHDRPRKWTGSGNTATLGGTPPYAKSCEFWKGFLGLGNVSDDGVTFSPLDLVLSDDPDATWTECNENEIYVTTLTLDETPGAIMAMKVLGDDLIVYKTDGIVVVTFTGGVTRFRRRKLDFPMGILAPLSLQSLGRNQHIFLAEDRNLYITNGQSVEQLPRNVQKSLHDNLTSAKAPWAVGMVDEDNETYHFFYERSGTTYNKGRISFNYTTGEFTKGSYPFEVSSAVGFRAAPTSDMDLLVGATSSDGKLVYELESGLTDNGTAVSRQFDIDWTQLGTPGDKYLLGGEFVFKKSKGARVKISTAVDKSSKFSFEKVFSLKGSDPDETEVRVSYRVPSPLYGSWFSFRVQMYHDVTAAEVRLLEFEPEFIPVHPVAEDQPQTHFYGNRG